MNDKSCLNRLAVRRQGNERKGQYSSRKNEVESEEENGKVATKRSIKGSGTIVNDEGPTLRSTAPIEPIKCATVLNQRAHSLSLVRQRKQTMKWLQSDLLGHWIRCLWGLVRGSMPIILPIQWHSRQDCRIQYIVMYHQYYVLIPGFLHDLPPYLVG